MARVALGGAGATLKADEGSIEQVLKAEVSLEERVFNSTIPVEDQHGRFAFRTDAEAAKTIIGQGFGIGMGNGQRVRAVRLTVPLSTIAAGGDADGRAVTPPGLRVRFVFREHVAGRYYIHTHKKGLESSANRCACKAVIESVLVGGKNDTRC